MIEKWRASRADEEARFIQLLKNPAFIARMEGIKGKLSAMKMDLHPPDSYYEFHIDKNGRVSYSFNTAFDVNYLILFKPSPYIFGEHNPFAHLVFECSALASFAGPQSYVRDDKIADTIAAIFIDFYNKSDEHTCFFIGDSSDGKQHVRKHKFDEWFVQYNKGAFLKFDSNMTDSDGVTYLFTLIFKKGNKYLNEISQAFAQMISGIHEGK